MYLNKMFAIGALVMCSSTVIANPVFSGNVDRSNSAIHVGIASSLSSSGLNSVYSDLLAGPDGFASFPDTVIDTDGQLEVAGFADYASISTGSILLDQIRFIGGVNQVGGTVFFDFFDSSGVFIDGIGVSLNQSGTLLWTVNLGTAITIANEGFIRMSIDDENLSGSGSTARGRWFLGNNGATIGDAGNAEVSPDFNFNFELNSSIPAPGSLVLLGLGGIVVGRRRR